MTATITHVHIPTRYDLKLITKLEMANLAGATQAQMITAIVAGHIQPPSHQIGNKPRLYYKMSDVAAVKKYFDSKGGE